MVKSIFKRLGIAKKGENLEELSDEILIQKYEMTLDTIYVSALMQRYARQITAFAWKGLGNDEEVKDFSQDVFVKLSAKLKDAKIESFKSWLYRFMQNLIIDKGRRRKLFDDFVAEQEGAEESADVPREIERQLDDTHLKSAIADLNERERACIEMLYYEECSYAEIMKATGLNFNQVRGLKDRTLKKLKERLIKIYKD